MLAGDLYVRVYTRPTARSFSRQTEMISRRDLLAELSAANIPVVQDVAIQAGPCVRVDADGQVVVVKDGYCLHGRGYRACDRR